MDESRHTDTHVLQSQLFLTTTRTMPDTKKDSSSLPKASRHMVCVRGVETWFDGPVPEWYCCLDASCVCILPQHVLNTSKCLMDLGVVYWCFFDKRV